MPALDERHDDGPDIPEKCDICFRRDEDVVKCCEYDCDTYIHKHCAKQCEACGEVVCADCTATYDGEPVCLTCQSSLVRAQLNRMRRAS